MFEILAAQPSVSAASEASFNKAYSKAKVAYKTCMADFVFDVAKTDGCNKKLAGAVKSALA